MARSATTIETGRSAEAVFDEVADLSAAPEWDPNVSSVTRVDEGPVRAGSRFLVTTDFTGRTQRLLYEVVEYDRPHRVAWRASTGRMVTTDAVTVAGSGRTTYERPVELKGAGRLVAPIAGLAFRLVGSRAAAGLARHLRAATRS